MFSNLDELLAQVTPDVYEQLKRAVEIGKWPNGLVLSKEQRGHCLQAVIAYEQKHIPEQERTAYVPPKPTPCGSPDDETQPLSFKQ